MNEFERRVAEALEENGWHVIAKGKGYDLLALKPGIALLIECKGWNRSIGGKTLRSIVNKLREQQDKLPAHLSADRAIVPIVVVAGQIGDLYLTDPVRVFDFNSFKNFLEM